VHSFDLQHTRDTGVTSEVYFYEQPPGTVIRDPGDDPHEMPVRDGWSSVNKFSLDRDGFALREFRSRFEQWDDDIVGAKRVVVFDHTIRAKRERKAADGGNDHHATRAGHAGAV
jgi:hypothetical protein